MIKLILLSVLGAAVFTTVAAESKASCGENSQPGCGQNCGKKCSDYPPGSTRVSFVCSQICRLDGCDCSPGFVFDNFTNSCVVPNDCRIKAVNCSGENEIYEICPAKCPPGVCGIDDLLVDCAASPQIGDANCAPPACRCQYGFYRNAEGKCVTLEECPPTCGDNEVASNCINGNCFGARYCSQKGAPIICVDLLPGTCESGCLCKKGYLRDDRTNQCVPEDKCPKIPKCKGVNQVYDYCPAPCPPRNCSVNSALIKCAAPPQLGDPDCKPGCRCKEGYKYGKNGDCIPEDQCDPFCYGNEVPSNCTNGGCQGAKYCSEKGADIKCVKLDEDQCVKGCLCRKGYLRDEITGICVKEDKCPKIPKCKGVNQVYDYCPAPCPPRNCSVNSAIIRCAAPPQLGDPECKPGCRCKDGYKYGKNGDCIPENQCDPFCYGNEVPSNCTNGGCQGAKYCSEKGAEIKCVKLSEDQCLKGCLCRKGYLRDEITGICVKEDKCPKIPKCKGVNQVYDYCPAPCPPRNCSVNEALILCITPPQLGDPECKPGCRCKDGYKYGKNGDCIPENQCEQNQCNRPNEVYQVCPGCSPQTCESIGKKYNCPLSPSPSTCKGACRCKPGFYRNKIGDCILRENCLKCRGPNEFYSCGGACDNVCETLKVQNQTHCPIINIKCNEMCYCESGYARNKKGVCIPIKKCPPPRPTETCTGPNEKYDKCAPPCSPQGCNSLVGPTIRCLFVLPPGQCIGACRCIEGHYRNDKGICIPKEECELCTRKNEVYDECPPNCSPDTCASLYEDNSDCVAPDVCRPACRCTKGTSRNEDGDCIPVNDCPCKIGKSFKSDDSCNTCSCGNGRRSDSACTLRVCEPSGTTFLNVRDVPTACPIGKSYLADDGCNTCDCTDGTRGTSICTASFAPCDLADPTAELE